MNVYAIFLYIHHRFLYSILICFRHVLIVIVTMNIFDLIVDLFVKLIKFKTNIHMLVYVYLYAKFVRNSMNFRHPFQLWSIYSNISVYCIYINKNIIIHNFLKNSICQTSIFNGLIFDCFWG